MGLAGSGSSGSRSGLKRFYEWFLGVRVSLGVVFVLCVVCGFVVWGLTVYSFKFVVGEIRVISVGVGVYWDSNCDNPVESLSWGKIAIDPLGSEASKNVTFYVRNEGSGPVVIRLNATKWSPLGVERYMRLSWDYDGRVVSVDEMVRVRLILFVDSGIWFESPRIQQYSFDIIISAV